MTRFHLEMNKTSKLCINKTISIVNFILLSFLYSNRRIGCKIPGRVTKVSKYIMMVNFKQYTYITYITIYLHYLQYTYITYITIYLQYTYILNGVIMLDLRKAFDLISHECLLEKLVFISATIASGFDHTSPAGPNKQQSKVTYPRRSSQRASPRAQSCYFSFYLNDLPLHRQ